jgi:hypothetical protein
VTTGTPGASDYDRGVAAGIVLQRLDGHDRHLAEINGSQKEMVVEQTKMNSTLSDMKMAIQRIEDKMTADKATVATTAEAVESERKTKADALATTRAAADTRWTPLNRLIAVLVCLAAVTGAIIGILTATGR